MYHDHSDQSLCTGEDGKWAGLGSQTWNTQSVLQNSEMWNTRPDFLDCVSLGKDIHTDSFDYFYLAFPWIYITLLTLIVNEICFLWLKQRDNVDMVSCSRCLPYSPCTHEYPRKNCNFFPWNMSFNILLDDLSFNILLDDLKCLKAQLQSLLFIVNHNSIQNYLKDRTLVMSVGIYIKYINWNGATRTLCVAPFTAGDIGLYKYGGKERWGPAYTHYSLLAECEYHVIS